MGPRLQQGAGEGQARSALFIYGLIAACTMAVAVGFAFHPQFYEGLAKPHYIHDLQDLPLGPVRLAGTVTYLDKHNSRAWLQDETGAISLPFSSPNTLPQVGQKLVVSARKTHPYDPLLSLSSVELREVNVISSTKSDGLPAPMSATINSLPAQDKNGMRIVLTGVVHEVFRDEDGLTQLAIGQGGPELWLTAPASVYNLHSLLDSTIQATGVSEVIYAADGRALRRRVLVAGANDLHVLQPAPSLVPAYRIRELYRGLEANSGHMVVLRGTVRVKLGANSWLVEGQGASIACTTDALQDIALGSTVEVRGYPVANGIRIDLFHAQIRASSQPRPEAPEGAHLETIAAVRGLPSEKAGSSLPVRVAGVVTFVDDDWGQMFLQDSTGGIYIKYSGAAFPIVQGQRLLVTGITGAGNYAPVILAPKFRKLGAGVLPAPRPVTQEEALSGVLDSQFVEIEGIIHPIRSGQDLKHMSVDLYSTFGPVHMELGPHFGPPEYVRKLEDARVRVKGVCGTIFNSRRQLIGIQMFVSQAQNIRVLNPGETSPFHQTRVPISKLLRFSADKHFDHRVKVAGTVTAVGNGFLYIEDNTGGLEVRGEMQEVHPGDYVEAAGYAAAAGGYSPVLRDATLRLTGDKQRVTLRDITAEEAFDGRYDSQLITIEGQLLSTVSSLNSKTFLLESKGRAFGAELYILRSSARIPEFKNGSILRLTGICSTQVNRDTAYLLLAQEPAGFKLIIRSPEDMVVVRNASWWNAGHTMMVLSTLLLIIVAGVLALLLTRRRIRQQAAALERALEKGRGIRELIAATNEVTAAKNFSARVAPIADDDLAQLGDEFNQMLTELEIREKQKVAAEMQLQHQALTDELTGLPNRRLLADRLAQSLARAEREQTPVAILYLDLDGFKLVNDSLGHRIGDILLAEVADRLQARIRKADTLARLGGDEFAVVLTSLHQKDDAEKVAGNLLEVIVRRFEIEGHDIRISASIGISVYPENGATPTELLQQADSAMYAAKRQGKNRAFFFTAEIGSMVRERVTLEHQLRGALDRGEISLHYQPEFEVEGNKLVRFEALARWTHPTLGEIPPSKFIPVAEESGLITALGAYVLEQACLAAIEWQNQAPGPIQVAVNVSSIELLQQGFVERVAEVLRHTGLPAHLLQIELTETVMVSGTQRATEAMTRLRALGISLAIDDFGTGYSCFGYLPQLPFNALKIDRGFVKELGSRPEMKAMVQSLITLAHNLSMQVIVEGVETTEQLEIVQAFGGNHVQGYLLGRPTSKPLDVIQSAASKAGDAKASAAKAGK